MWVDRIQNERGRDDDSIAIIERLNGDNLLGDVDTRVPKGLTSGEPSRRSRE